MDVRYKTVGGERCQNCGKIYKTCWKAPDDIWEKITGGEPGKSMGGTLCIECFDSLCAANNISLFWDCRDDSRHWNHNTE